MTASENMPKNPDTDRFINTFVHDIRSGLVVFLLALPLSLGIATASGFPPLMGVVTAVIGGIVGGMLTGSPLSIKGPAAGLIVIMAGSVDAFGGGTTGWQMTLAVTAVAGCLQFLFGIFKWGRYVDVFPISVIHGMLAAIGLIIIAKQIPVMLHVDPELTKGKGPIELLLSIPGLIRHFNPMAGGIGLISLMVAIGWGMIPHPVARIIPAPLLVLAIAIPGSLTLNLAEQAPAYTLVKIGSLREQLGFNADFHMAGHWGTFVKYVMMISLVASLESLLTVKAIDLRDPWKRKSSTNRDLVAVGVANTICGLIGGLPMISEVARSSANIAQGGRTKWANIFHGTFLLIAVLLAVPMLELIPNSALAALLIVVGIKLAHPREFIQMKLVGIEQISIFLTTIIVTLAEDLLIGVASGMVLKLLIHWLRGMPLASTFRAGLKVDDSDGTITLRFGKAAVFTNYLAIRDTLASIPQGRRVVLDLSDTVLLDHSVLSNLENFRSEYLQTGGDVTFAHMDSMHPISAHPLASRRRM